MTSAMGKLRIGEVARRTGLTPAVLRAWETRYALVAPERSAGGTRLYSAVDEARLRAMQAHMAAGLSAAEAARMVRANAPSVEARGTHASPIPAGASTMPDASELQDASGALFRALAQLDRVRAERALDRLLGAFTFETLATAAFLPYLVDVGRRWKRGEASIAEEHLAIHILRTRLLSLTQGLAQAPRARAVLACPTGEQHDIALVLLAVALERRGWQVALLGADTPVATIAEAAHTVRADLVILAAMLPDRFSSVSTSLRAVSSQWPLMIAGPGATRAVADDCGAELLGGDPVRAAASLDVRFPSTIASIPEA